MKKLKLIVVLASLFLIGHNMVAQERMNVLFIAVDDLNDWVGFLGGHPQAKTPHMDRFAKQSMVFENSQCAAPSCNPSRAALMSGIAPYESGIYNNPDEMREAPLIKNAIMLPRYLSNHGYTSMVRGKIFHHADMDEQSWDIMSNQNKDKISIPEDQLTDMSPYKDIQVSNKLFDGTKGNLYWESTMEPKEITKDYQNALWAAEWLSNSAEQATPKPFFLACGIFRPHLPWVVPAEYFARFDKDKIQLPPIKDNDLEDTSVKKGSKEYKHALKHGLREEAVWAYLASMAYADDCVGVILDALEKSPYKDNTIVVLWGDHGWHLGEKQRYKKFTLWEESARMPLLIKVPGLKQGRTTKPVSLIDLYPTLVELAGLPAKEGLSGKSIVPILKNPDIKWNTPAITTQGKGNYSLRNERWRYIHRADGAEELYDHSKDPQEWTNLASNPAYTDIIKSMKQYLPTSK